MPIFTAKMPRRAFLFTPAAFYLASCERRHWNRQLDPVNIREDLLSNRDIDRLRKGEINFLHKDLEPMSENGKRAFAIIQRALFALDLIKGDPSKFNFGVYGPKTAGAIKQLQDLGGMDPVIGRDGRRFGANSLQLLETALDQKISNQ